MQSKATITPVETNMSTAVMCVLVALANGTAAPETQIPSRSLDTQKTLYLIGYAHLDSQWRWTYETTINDYLKATLDDNFTLLEKYPGFVFNFSGSSRYEKMKEYYPDQYERMKKYISEGRWFVCGSSVDECDVLIPSPESVLRQILYGNQYFRKEFNVESADFMLPDCFGFPAYLPSLWAHTGLLGFSTQKLSWGSVVGVPFNVGVWEGPDGKSVLAALNCGSYTGSVPERPDIHEEWVNRLNENGQKSGVWADYRYYGVGDMGGAPREEDVKKALGSLGNEDSKIEVLLTSTDRMYKDITPEQRSRLPRYTGELMLTEHSSGSMTSQAYMKRWNRKNEQLADAAERAAVISSWLGASDYPQRQIHNAWDRVLVSQMHDILPGTCLPKAYNFSWNDEIIASNGFASVLTHSIDGISQALDTRVKGQAVIVYNPLSIPREDVVEATVMFPSIPKAVRVYDYAGKEVPSQLVEKTADGAKILFLAKMPAVGVGVFDVRSSSKPCAETLDLRVENSVLENAFYRVTVNPQGDIASVYDKQAEREMLTGPARLEFHRGTPASWPAWNMDWEDRQYPATGFVDGPVDIRIVEKGPVRAAIEVTRKANNSFFTQRICLAAGEAGRRVEIFNDVDWQSSACVLKAAFPLTVSNPVAVYNQGLGVIERQNNHPKQFEMLSREWFSLTDISGDYGVTVLEDCKFGSDKPSDDVVRLTLLYTPGARHFSYNDHLTQDWGRHTFTYGLYGHTGSWQEGLSEWQGRRLNQPLRAFQAFPHKGALGSLFSMLQLNSEHIDVRAIKMAEDGDLIIVRLQELIGRNAEGVTLNLGRGIVSAYEVDGQERRIGDAAVIDGKLAIDMTPYAIRSFALKPADAPCRVNKPISKAVTLNYNVNAFTADGQAADGVFGKDKHSMPAEMIPTCLEYNGVLFELGPKAGGQNNAVACQGQMITLPKGKYNRLYLLAAADTDTQTQIKIGKKIQNFAVQAWTGYIGQYDNRRWNREFPSVDPDYVGWVTGIETGYIKRDNLAWFCSHSHDASGLNEAYHFSYIFEYEFTLPSGATVLVLPNDPSIKIFAVSVAAGVAGVKSACDLYDNFDDRQDVVLRNTQGRYSAGKPAVGTVVFERAESYSELKLNAPMNNDYADRGSNNGVIFTCSQDKRFVLPKRGNYNGILERLNDGLVGQNNDDLLQCTHFDNGQGRFMADLQKPMVISSVNTFSWHRSDRAPQRFSLWAAIDNIPMEGDLAAADGSGWTFIAEVDTGSLGDGGVHASLVSFPNNTQYRYLMWVAERAYQGTFFNEIDIIVPD
jgi:alpha-mannosidase